MKPGEGQSSKVLPSVLITGASRGLGLETALTLAEQGFHVWASMRNLKASSHVLEAAERRGVHLETVQLDVTDGVSIRTAVETLLSGPGHLYGVVNNAGVTVRGYFEDLSDEEVRRVLEVNLFGAVNVAREVLPYMRNQHRGRIIMVSSIAGRIGSMSLTAYVTSKFALEGFSESLFLEAAPLGVQVVLVEPGIFDTDIWSPESGVAKRALDNQGPYYKWFRRTEEAAHELVRTSKLRTEDVAQVISQAMLAKRPRMRYMVGRRARLIMTLRNLLPGELFERLYFGAVLRRITG